MNSINDEVMRWVSQNNDWFNASLELLVARGKIPDYSVVNIYGYQPTVGTSFIPLWEQAAAYTYPVSAANMYLSSSNSDTASVRIEGLGAGYVPLSEVVVLNGTTAVATVNQYLRINGMAVSSGTYTGTITLKDSGGTVTYSQINPEIGRTQSAIYTVPAGYTFYLKRINLYTSLNGNRYVTYRNRTVSASGLVQVTQQAPFAISYEALRIHPRPFTEKTDIQLQCAMSEGTGAVAISQEGLLIKNTAE